MPPLPRCPSSPSLARTRAVILGMKGSDSVTKVTRRKSSLIMGVIKACLNVWSSDEITAVTYT